MEEPKMRCTGVFIPVEVLTCQEISPNEKLLLSFIDALYNEDFGGCFASNTYLARLLNLKEDTISKCITNLRSIGLIEDVSFNGRIRVIRATIEKYVEKCKLKKGQSYAASDKNPTQGRRKILGRVGEKSVPSNIYRKEDRKEDKREREPSAKASASRSSSSSLSEKIDRTLHVRTSEAEHQKLIAEYGEDKTAQLYENLSLWKQTQPEKDLKKLINGDYARIKRWGMKSLKEAELSQQNLNLRELQNKQIADRLSKSNPKQNQRDLMEQSLKQGAQQKEILSRLIYDKKKALGHDMSNYEREGGPSEGS